MELWKIIEGFDKYLVSSFGRVKSLAGNREKILKPQPTRGGYLCVLLYVNGARKNKKIHRLVAEAFISNPAKLPVPNHQDLDKKNNKVTNLLWSTQKDNEKHARENGRANARTNPKRAKKLTYEKVLQIKEQNLAGKTCTALAKDFDVSIMTISKITRELSWLNPKS